MNAARQNGLLKVKMAQYENTFSGFYYTNKDMTWAVLPDPSHARWYNPVPLSKILSDTRYSIIETREVIDYASDLFKLACVDAINSVNQYTAISELLNNHVVVGAVSAGKPVIDSVRQTMNADPASYVAQAITNGYSGEIPSSGAIPMSFSPPTFLIRETNATFNDEQIAAINRFKSIHNQTFDLAPGHLPSNGNNEVDANANTRQSIISVNTNALGIFFDSIIDDGTAANDDAPIKLPLSFRVPDDYYSNISTPDSLEEMLATWGLDIYDGACFEIARFILNNDTDLMDNLRSTQKTTQFATIIGNSNDFTYQPPLEVFDGSQPTGPRSGSVILSTGGLAFREISNYYSFDTDPVIPTSYDSASQFWIDWKPIMGENAWFYGIGPGIRRRLINQGFISTLPYMMDGAGGFYFAPLSTTAPNLSFSSENNASMFGALDHMISVGESTSTINNLSTISNGTAVTDDQINMMKGMRAGIIKYFQTVKDTNTFLFYQGKTWNGTGWSINTGGMTADGLIIPAAGNVFMPPGATQEYVIPVDVQTWGICSLQPLVINFIFGDDSAALKMWNNLKTSCGRLNPLDNSLQGFGYTNFIDTGSEPFTSMSKVISAEWTFGAIMACKVLKAHYGDAADVAPYTVSDDLNSMLLFMTDPDGDLYFTNGNNGESYYNYANMRSETGFGWFANPIPSTTSTAWGIMAFRGYNPFVPGGKLTRTASETNTINNIQN